MAAVGTQLGRQDAYVAHKGPGLDSLAPNKPDKMVGSSYIVPELGMLRQEDQKFKIIRSYIGNLRRTVGDSQKTNKTHGLI